MRCAIVYVDGRIAGNCHLTFKECQETVGGFVQLLRLSKDCYVYVNEDGLNLNLPPNELATRFVRLYDRQVLIADQIRGPMVLVGRAGEGDLDKADEERLVSLYGEFMAEQGIPKARTVTVEKLIEFAGQFNEEIHSFGIEHDYVRGQIDLIMDAAGLPMEDEFRRDVFDAICVASDKFFRSKKS